MGVPSAQEHFEDFLREAKASGNLATASVEADFSGGTVKVHGLRANEVEWSTKYTLDEGIGYFNFVAEFYFDIDGNFLAHGLWE